MKKIIFTVITVIAFSIVSKANTISDEEIIRENNIKTIKTQTAENITTDFKIIGNIWDCLNVYSMYYKYFDNYFNYTQPEYASQLANGYFQNCMYGTEGGVKSGVLCKE